MRADLFVKNVLAKCEALKAAGFWPAEPRMRPRAWLQSFDEADRPIAAVLLDRFQYYNDLQTEALLKAAFHAIGDGRVAERMNLTQTEVNALLANAVFTRVDGERPRPTDSGNLFCRKARQVLNVPDHLMMEPEQAVVLAATGATVVFLDDFIGSGNQFRTSWCAEHGAARQSFVSGVT